MVTTQRTPWVGHEVEGGRTVGKNLYHCGFHRKEWVRQGKKA